ncbi:hypothetical protein AGMMS50293_14220 [Spirochaetia bacterium]|nr:hypothetical protein AGMMS50293_14220 [Spirochaetia bacterium]
MTTSINAALIEVPDATELAKAGSGGAYPPGGSYVLTGDITAANWTPPTAAFTGKFYGNGHTITIESFAAAADNVGLFGVANNALIRDLTVAYGNNDVTVTNETTTNIGSIAGSAGGITKILNCMVESMVKGMVKGMVDGKPVETTLILTSSSTSDVYIGGMVGYMAGGVRISNCRAALNVSLTSTGTGAVYAGGVAGFVTGTGGGAMQELIADVMVLGSVTLEKNDSGNIFAGGVAGYSTTAGIFARVVYDYGTVTAQRNGGTGLKDCEWGRNAVLEVPASTTAYNLNVGGLAGYAYGSGITIQNTVARGDITIGAGGTNTYVGGLAGYVRGSSGTSRVVFTGCVYESGLITVTAPAVLRMGGCIGYVFDYMEATDSYSRAALLEVKGCTGLYFGGFSGYLYTSTVTDCGSSKYSSSPLSPSAPSRLIFLVFPLRSPRSPRLNSSCVFV